jgi:hypothetical protein
MNLTLEALKTLLHYEPSTGVFLWKVRPRQRACSPIAGTINPTGYRQICVKQKIYRLTASHGKRDDNRIENLRLANKQGNQANSKRRITNTTGFKGVVVMNGRNKKYGARIVVNYKGIWLGYFYTAVEAHAAYCVAAEKHFGEFARVA